MNLDSRMVEDIDSLADVKAESPKSVSRLYISITRS